MILKEIQMDIPFVYNNSISNEESVEIYQRTWKDKRRQFHLLCQCMTSMIERLMPKLNTKNYWKIIIECVDKSPRDNCINLLGVISVQIKFDVDLFYTLNNYEKKKYIINKVIETIDYLSGKGFNEIDELKKTCEEIITKDYINEWLWKKPVRYKNKSVQIKILHDVDKVSIYMAFIDGNINKDVLLVEEIPDEWVYSKYLGKLEWVSENEARLITKDGKILSGKIV